MKNAILKSSSNTVTVNSDPQFCPPKLKPLLTRLIQSISTPVAYGAWGLELAIDESDVAKLKQISSHRIVYLPNHSTLDDGVVMFLLSARIGQLFHYLVAYEAFRGLAGKFLQRVGCYSIRRGVGDRPSVVQTLKILQQPASRLVLFPEGGCSYQNDTVMPFRSGAIELSFKAFERLIKKHDVIPHLYLVPVSIKYRYTHSMNSAIAKTLQDLETALKIQPTTSDFYQRLRAIAAKVLSYLEAEYDVDNSAIESDWNQRIQSLKDSLLNECETKLSLAPNPQLPMRERVYKIQSLLDSPRESTLELPPKTRERLKRTTVRLLNFDAIYDGYVASKPTPERFLDTLNRLEREIFAVDRPQLKGHRQAWIKIGEPIDLQDYWQAYQDDRDTTIDNLIQQLQQTVQTNLAIEQ